MNRKNEDIKNYAKQNGVYQYEIAEAMNISEMTLFRRLRHTLSPDQKQAMKNVVDQIAAERSE